MILTRYDIGRQSGQPPQQHQEEEGLYRPEHNVTITNCRAAYNNYYVTKDQDYFVSRWLWQSFFVMLIGCEKWCWMTVAAICCLLAHYCEAASNIQTCSDGL